jgi:uncharacterized membrane protein
MPLSFNEQVLRQLANLERRLDRMERRLAALEAGKAQVPSANPPESATQVQPLPADESVISISRLDALRNVLTIQTESADVSAPPLPPQDAPLPDAASSGSPPDIYAVRRELPRRSFSWRSAAPRGESSPQPQAKTPQPTLESLIGGRWFAFAGAIAVLVALVLFLRLAYTQGWLGRLSPALRCSLGAGFGLLLLGAGEVARRRINSWAAVGLLSAGVAGLYASVLAAYGMYHLLVDAAAFALLTTISGIGIATGARSRLPAVSIVSLVGAYLAPFLLDSPDPSPLVFPSYTLAILATGLSLAAWLRGGFRVVGALVWWGTLILGGLWILEHGEAHALIAMVFASLAWLMVHAGHVYATRAPDKAPAGEESPRSWHAAIPLHQLAMLASSFSYSAWTTMLCVDIAERTRIVPDWLPPFAIAGVTAVFAFSLIPALSLLRDIPRTGRERLGTALLAQTGGLVFAGTALATLGISAVPTWLALGLAAIVAGRLVRARGLDVYGVAAMGVGTARLFLHDWEHNDLLAARQHLHGLVVSEGMWWALGVGAGWVIAAILLLWRLPQQSKGRARPLAAVAMGLALLTLGASVVHPDADKASIVWTWIALTTFAFVLSPLGRAMKLNWLSAGACVPCLILWIATYALPRLDWSGSTHMLLLHPGLWSALCLAGLITAIAAWGLRELEARELLVARSAAASLAISLVWGATSLEAARVGAAMTGDRTVQLAFVSIWWALFSVALIVAGFKTNIAAARRAGLTLMGVATLKVVLYDLGGVPQVWRIASFLLVGLLMIGVAVGYSRVANRLLPSKSE